MIQTLLRQIAWKAKKKNDKSNLKEGETLYALKATDSTNNDTHKYTAIIQMCNNSTRGTKEELKIYQRVGCQLLVTGESWFAISSTWMKQWKSYLDTNCKNKMRPIDNKDIACKLNKDGNEIDLNKLENITWIHNDDYQTISKWYGVKGPVFERKVFEKKKDRKPGFNKKYICISPINIIIHPIYEKKDLNNQNNGQIMQFPQDSDLQFVKNYFEADCRDKPKQRIHIWCQLKDVKTIYPISPPAAKIEVNIDISKLDINKWMQVPFDYESSIELTNGMELLIEYSEICNDGNSIEWPLCKSIGKWKKEGFEIGDIIDCKHSSGKWKEAMIRTINDSHLIAVHYIGWSTKYDEWIDLCKHSNRVATRHTNTNNNYSLEIGSHIDCLDTKLKEPEWYVGKIINKKSDIINGQNTCSVLVHYVEFTSKFDAWINVESTRIAPLFSRTNQNTFDVNDINDCKEDAMYIWTFENENKETINCDDKISIEFNQLEIGIKIEYSLNNYQYSAIKLSTNWIEQTNVSTLKNRIFTRKQVKTCQFYWKFKNENGDMIECDKILCNKFNDIKIGSSIEYDIGEWKYKARRLNNCIIEQINSKTNKKRILYRCDNDSRVYYQTRFSNDKQLIGIAKQFHATIDASKLEIINIEKCMNDNKIHEIAYKAIYTAKKLQKQNETMQVEKLLFHGTSVNKLDKIVKNGFNRDFNQRKAYGKGVYFARDARYSLNYCDKHDSTGEQKMLVCKVLIDDYCVGNQSMIVPPDKPNGIDQYEIMVDNIDNPSIYVVTKDYHAIPAFIITFNKKVIL